MQYWLKISITDLFFWKKKKNKMILTRLDLAEGRTTTPLKDIAISDFKAWVRDLASEEDYIRFDDGKERRELKNRFGVTPELRKVNVDISKNGTQITGCPSNFNVSLHEWDLDDPFAWGSTLEEAIASFRESFDEDIEIIVKKETTY